MVAMILPQLGACRDMDEAFSRLNQLGAMRIGNGFYAHVFVIEVDERTAINPYQYQYSPERMWDAVPAYRQDVRRMKRVIKVAQRDPGGLMAARTAMLTKDYDDLAPRYYGILEFKGGWMGELELLTVAPKTMDAGHGAYTRHLTGGEHSRQPDRTVVGSSIYLRTLQEAMSAHNTRADAEPATGRNCVRWDIHADNVMMRGNQPVITDPVAAN
jgi:hypothetical protein